MPRPKLPERHMHDNMSWPAVVEHHMSHPSFKGKIGEILAHALKVCFTIDAFNHHRRFMAKALRAKYPDDISGVVKWSSWDRRVLLDGTFHSVPARSLFSCFCRRPRHGSDVLVEAWNYERC